MTEEFDNVRVLSELEYSYLRSAARDNSGSVKQLLLDAGIKRDAKGYNVEATVDFETYYKASYVSQGTKMADFTTIFAKKGDFNN